MRNRTLKRCYCYHSCTVMKCRDIERESAEDIIEACTKKEAREIFKKRKNFHIWRLLKNTGDGRKWGIFQYCQCFLLFYCHCSEGITEKGGNHENRYKRRK